MVRSFVAIDIPDYIRGRLSEAQWLLNSSDAKLRIVSPDNIHITLKFIGEVDDGRLKQIEDALSLLDSEPFKITIRNVAGNPPNKPKVVWCNVEDEGGCRILHSQIENAFAPLGIEKDRRKYTPHATLARVSRFHKNLNEKIADLSFENFGSFDASSIVLKKSTLTPQGSIYEDILEAKF